MIHHSDFTGKLIFEYKEKEYNDRSCYWTDRLYLGGIEVVVPEMKVKDVYEQEIVIPKHKELIPFTEDEGKHLKYAYDKIKKRIMNQLNK